MHWYDHTYKGYAELYLLRSPKESCRGYAAEMKNIEHSQPSTLHALAEAALSAANVLPFYQDKVAVVTGGASGIGKATSLLFARMGLRVEILDLGPCSPQDFAPFEQRVRTHVLNVCNPDECRALATRIAEDLGPITTLVNAAGIVLPDGAQGASIVMEQLFRVNVLGTAHVCEAFLPHFGAHEATIVNLSSIVASIGWPGRTAYVTSKGGVEAMTRSMALEYYAQSGIRVNAVAPGLVATPLIRKVIQAAPDPYQAYLDRASLQASGRMLEPEEVATSILYLATTLSKGVLGETIDLSDGRRAGYLPVPCKVHASDNQSWLDFMGPAHRQQRKNAVTPLPAIQ
jgi:2-keto-3-deoxy-L-fuconate dehydrogenase